MASEDPLVARVAADARARSPVDQREADSIERLLRELGCLERPFDEHADPVHVTGSALVLGSRGVVLVKHRHLGIWVQPGGHVDPGETPWEAARREAAEETGLDVTLADDPPRLVHVDVHPGPRGHTHLDLRYLCRAGDGDPAPPPEESQDVHWYDWPAAFERAEPALVPLLRHLAAGR